MLGLFVLWAMPHWALADGEQRYKALEALLLHGQIAARRYSIVGPLFGAPLFFVGHLLGNARAGAVFLNVALFTLFILLLARELRSELSPGAGRAALLLLVFGSMFPNHLQRFYGEVFTAVTVTLGVFWLARGRTILGWSAIVLGVVNTPAAIIGMSLIAIGAALRTRRWGHLAAPLVAVAFVLVENRLMRGSALSTGYANDAGVRTVMPYSGKSGFSYPFVFGALSLLVSFGKGLVFFAPGLFAPLPKEASERLRFVHRSLVWFVVGLGLVYARWWSWYGGWFWGPRFLLTASIPASIALGSQIGVFGGVDVRPWWQRALLTTAVGLSFWVGVNGLIFGQTGLDMCTRDDYALEMLCVFTPELSPLLHPFVDFHASVPLNLYGLAYAACLVWLCACGWLARRVLAGLVRDLRARLETVVAASFAGNESTDLRARLDTVVNSYCSKRNDIAAPTGGTHQVAQLSPAAVQTSHEATSR